MPLWPFPKSPGFISVNFYLQKDAREPMHTSFCFPELVCEQAHGLEQSMHGIAATANKVASRKPLSWHLFPDSVPPDRFSPLTRDSKMSLLAGYQEPPVLLSWRGLGRKGNRIFDVDSWTKFNTAFFPVGSICRSLQSSVLSSAT